MPKLMTPGPVEVCSDVLAELSRSMIHHRGDHFKSIVRAVSELLQEISRSSRHVALFNGTGTLATEAIIYSFLKPGDRLIVISHGEFGDRLAETAIRRGVDIYKVRHNPGESLRIDEFKGYLDRYRPNAVAFIANETSTGHRLDEIAEASRLAKEYGAYILVDAVSAYGGEHIDLDRWGIDALASCSHKALSSPPGVSFILLNDDLKKVAEKISRSGTPPPRYLDIHLHLESMDRVSSTPYTAVIPVFRALKKSLENIVYSYGVGKWVEMHKERSDILYRSISNTHIKPLIKNPRYRTNTLAAFILEDKDVSSKYLLKYLESRGYIVSEGMGSDRDRVIRIGTMGCIDINDIYKVVDAILEFFK